METNRIFDDFNKHSIDYRKIHDENIKLSGVDSDYFSEHKIQIVKKEVERDNINFLDFGCGDGNSARFFLKYFPESNYSGIDISSESLKIAKSKKILKTDFQIFNGEKLPFSDNSFDVVFTACVFHHIGFQYHENLIQEIYRVLKKNGTFIIFEHNTWNPITRKMVNTCPFDKDAVLLNPTYTKKLLHKVFQNQKTKFTLFFPRHKIFNLLIRLEKYLSIIPVGGQYYTKSSKK